MNFEDIINEWVEKVEVNTNDILQTITLMIGKELVYISPVDTGRFRGNWQITIGSPTNHSLVRYDKEGTQTIGDMARDVRILTAGQVAYIQNTITYGADLETGTSRQAPDGIISVTAPKFNLIVQQAIRLHPSP